jgi:tetratricopeptide (TPR) repeat protein
MAGAFVMRGFIKDPTQFNSHIAASPGMRKDVIDTYHDFFNKSDEKLCHLTGQSLYFTMGGIAAEGTENVQIVNELDEILRQRAPSDFNWDYQPLIRHAHMTTPYATFYEGITNTFTGYQPPKISTYKDYLNIGGMKGITNYYQERAVKYQENAEVPNRFIRRLGGIIFNDGHSDEAISLLEKNSQNHPESIWAYNALARLYDQNKQPKKSLTTFKKALSLAKKQKSPGVGYLEGEIERVKNN